MYTVFKITVEGPSVLLPTPEQGVDKVACEMLWVANCQSLFKHCSVIDKDIMYVPIYPYGINAVTT